MASLLDLELIKKWVNISDEELMQRLVKDAVVLQKEAEANKRAADIAKRKADSSYTMEMIKRFFRQYKYLSQYFSDKEIEIAVKNNMGKRDLTSEQWIHTMSEECSIGMFLRHEKGKFTESRGSWSREKQDMGSVYLVANQYQNVSGAPDVTRELLLSRCPWVAEYKVSIYEVGIYNDWIYFENPEKTAYSTHDLYVPFSALMEHDPEKIVQTHRDYWHRYNAKYDEDTETFLKSDFVKGILEKVSK